MPSDTALALRRFGPLGILAIVLILVAGNLTPGGVVIPAGGLLVLLWVRLSATPWREIGYVRPKSWAADVLLGLALGVALKFLTKAVVLPLLGADPVNHAYHALAGNTAILPFAVLGMLAAGFGEETVFRGFLFERLGKLLGSDARAKTTIVLATAALFALLHYPDQGLPGVEQATVTGLTFGAIYALTGRLWLLMVAHAAYDLTALAIIYANVESSVAHLIFR